MEMVREVVIPREREQEIKPSLTLILLLLLSIVSLNKLLQRCKMINFSFPCPVKWIFPIFLPKLALFSLLFFCCKSPTQYGAPSIYIQQLQKLSVHWTWMKKNRFTKNAASGSGCRAIKINETDFKDKNSPADASKCDKTQASSNTAAPATAHIVDTHRVTLSGDSTTTTWMLLNPAERGYAA